VRDRKWVSEAKLNAALSTGESNRGRVLVEGVVGKVILQGTTGALEGLGGIGRALEVAVVGDQGVEAAGKGVIRGLVVDVEGGAGGLYAGGKRTPCAKVDGGIFGLPLVDVDLAEQLGARLERGEHTAIEYFGKV
jgi:hypothetical protein